MGNFVDKWLPAVGDIVAGSINAIASGHQAAENRKFQKEMYERQVADARQDYQTQLADQWEFEKYRSVPNQTKLMREAGINPNGSGQISTGGVSSSPAIRGSDVPSASNLPIDFSGIQDSMHVLQQGLVASSQLEVQREQNRIAEMNAKTAMSRAIYQNMLDKARAAGEDSSTAIKKAELAVFGEKHSANIAKIKSEIELNEARKATELQNQLIAKEMLPYQKDEMKAKIKTLESQGMMLISQASYFDELGWTEFDKRDVMRSEAAFLKAQTHFKQLESEWKAFTNTLKDIHKALQEANLTKAEKEAKWAGVVAFASSYAAIMNSSANMFSALNESRFGGIRRPIHQGYNIPPGADKSGGYSNGGTYYQSYDIPDFDHFVLD